MHLYTTFLSFQSICSLQIPMLSPSIPEGRRWGGHFERCMFNMFDMFKPSGHGNIYGKFQECLGEHSKMIPS